MTQYYHFNLHSSSTNEIPFQSILPSPLPPPPPTQVQVLTRPRTSIISEPAKDFRTVINDLNEVYSCASTISNGFNKSSIHASTPIHLPSINELDCMIDITGKMMRVLHDAKHNWFIPHPPPLTTTTPLLPVTQYRTVVSNTQESRTTTTTTATKRPLKRQRSTSSSSHHYPSRNECHSCKSTETPEWRKGPLGPRTLCNACGLIWTKLCKEKADEKSNSPTLSDDGHSEGTTTTTLSSTSLNNKKYTLSFLLS